MCTPNKRLEPVGAKPQPRSFGGSLVVGRCVMRLSACTTQNTQKPWCTQGYAILLTSPCIKVGAWRLTSEFKFRGLVLCGCSKGGNEPIFHCYARCCPKWCKEFVFSLSPVSPNKNQHKTSPHSDDRIHTPTHCPTSDDQDNTPARVEQHPKSEHPATPRQQLTVEDNS